MRKGLAKSLQHGLEPVQRQILVCGNLLSWGAHGVAMAPDADPEFVWAGVAEALYRIRRADKLSGSPSVAMIKDLPRSDAQAEWALRRFSYRAFETEPNMVLSLRSQWTSFEAYLADMKSDYRSGIKKQLKDIEKAELELLSLDASEVAAHAEEIYGLYRQVHDRQKFRLVTITPGWIPALAARFGDDFRTSVLRPKGGGRLLGFITTLKDKEGAIGYYVGYDREAAQTLPVYLRMLYRAVEDAITMRAQWVSLGRTALAPKAKLGALPQPTVCHIRHRVQAANLLVKGLLTVLPEPEDAPERNPFKPTALV
ncbi:MAG: GNAT family N-acetyltransferase [Paludibacteraceae bacterium]